MSLSACSIKTPGLSSDYIPERKEFYEAHELNPAFAHVMMYSSVVVLQWHDSAKQHALCMPKVQRQKALSLGMIVGWQMFDVCQGCHAATLDTALVHDPTKVIVGVGGAR